MNNIEIGNQFNISQNLVWNWSKKYNWKKPDELREQLLKNRSKNSVKIKKDDSYYKAKELYETTTTPTKEICKQVNWTYDMLRNRICKGNWIRPKEIEKQVCRNRIKQVQSTYTDEKWEQIRKKMSETNQKIWKERPEEETQKIVEHRKETMNEKTEEELQEIYSKISKTVSNRVPEINAKRIAKIHKHEARDNTLWDSSYEVKVYEYCLDNNLEFKKQVPIKFYYNDKQRKVIVDFVIEGKYYECKGGHLIKGVYNNSVKCENNRGITTKQKLSIYSDYNVTVITDDLGIRLLTQYNKHLFSDKPIKFIHIDNFEEEFKNVK